MKTKNNKWLVGKPDAGLMLKAAKIVSVDGDDDTCSNVVYYERSLLRYACPTYYYLRHGHLSDTSYYGNWPTPEGRFLSLYFKPTNKELYSLNYSIDIQGFWGEDQYARVIGMLLAIEILKTEGE